MTEETAMVEANDVKVAEQEQEVESENHEGLVKINSKSNDLMQVGEQALGALVSSNHNYPTLFWMGNDLIRVDNDFRENFIDIEKLDKNRLKYELTARAYWFERVENKKTKTVKLVRSAPNDKHVSHILGSLEIKHKIPRIVRVAPSPFVTKSGRIVTAPGYDPESQTYYNPMPKDFVLEPIPEVPDEVEVQSAVALIKENLFVDVQFEGVAEEANAIALLILPFVRDLILGNTPLHLIEKPAAGHGATYLVQAITTVFLGHSAGANPAPNNDDEWRKLISSNLCAGEPFFFIDNIGQKSLEFNSIKAALTTATHMDRRLGGNDLIKVPVRCIWVATGANPTSTSELLRRAVRIRLNVRGVARPADRSPSDYVHPNLLEHIQQYRAIYVRAILVLIQNWIAKGMPESRGHLPGLGSYDDYRRVLGGILDCAGITAFLCNRDDMMRHADPEELILTGFLEAAYEAHSNEFVTIAELMPFAGGLGLTGSEDSKRKSLGHKLRIMHGANHGGYVITVGKLRDGYQTYKIGYAS
jgi:putative DNA primase/helicase